MITIEMTEEERAALLPILKTLENKAGKGEFWKGRVEPVKALFERIRSAKSKEILDAPEVMP